MSAAGSRENLRLAVVEILVVPEEVVDDEALFPDAVAPAGPAPADLLVKDRRKNLPSHDNVEDVRAIEPGGQHVHAHGDHRIRLLLEPPDCGIGVGDVGSDDLGVSSRRLGMQLVEITGQSRGVVLGDRKNNRLARSLLLPGSQLAE